MSLLLTIIPEGYESSNSTISCIDDYFRGNNTLEIDAVPSAAAAPDKEKFLLLEKLKLIVKVFEGKCDKEQMRNLMLTAIDSNNDENAFTDLLQYGSIEEIQEMALMIVKYKLVEVLQFENDIEQNALHLFVLNGYSHFLKVFIKLGVKINQADAYGQTPLHLAVQENSMECLSVLLSAAPEISVNEINDRGHTPLSLSVSNNNLSMTKELIKAGAIPSIENPTTGFNCLHAAVCTQQPSLELIRYLIEVDQSMLFAGRSVRQLAVENNLSKKIIDYLTTFYDDDDNDDDDGNDDDDDDEGDIFKDELCMKQLYEIFDKNDNWKMWVTILDLEDKIGEWELMESPSQALFSHLKVSS